MKKLKILLIGLLLCTSCNNPNKDNRKPGWLYINFGREPSTYDFRKTTEPTAENLAGMVTEGLMKACPATGKIELAQAEKYTVSDDKLTYVFFIRDGYWSNGEPVTAYDFANSWLESLDPNFPSSNAYFFYCIKNGKAAKEGRVPLDQVGIKAHNDKILEITLEDPNNAFLSLLSSTYYYPIRYQNHKPSLENFLSNGPLKIIEWTQGKIIRLIKNPKYRLADQLAVEGVEISLVTDHNTVYELFQSRQLDLIGGHTSPLPPTLLESLHPTAISACVFNTTKFPFNNVNFRRALAVGFEREDLNRSLHNCNTKPAFSFVPDAFKFHSYRTYTSEGRKEAQKYLQAALDELGITLDQLPIIKINYSSSEINVIVQKVAQILQQQWMSNLGIRVELERLDLKSFTQNLGKKDYDIGLLRWTPSYASPYTFLERFDTQSNPKNYTGWESQEYSKCLRMARGCDEKEEEAELLLEMENILAREVPLFPIIQWDTFFLKNDRLKHVSLYDNGALNIDSIELKR